jgi:hypothetical protein
MVGSSSNTCALSARRVNMVPRSIPRSFEKIAKGFYYSEWYKNPDKVLIRVDT